MVILYSDHCFVENENADQKIRALIAQSIRQQKSHEKAQTA